MGIFLYVLLAIICWGVSPILEKAALKNLSPMNGVLFRNLATAIVIVIFVGMMTKFENIGSMNWKAVALIIIAGILAAGVGQLAYYTALKNGRASMIVPMAASYPLVTVILSILVLGEALTAGRVVGALLIVSGVILVKAA